MRRLVHLWRLIADALHFSVSQRNIALVAIIVLGIAAVIAAIAVQVAAPVALYPFL